MKKKSIVYRVKANFIVLLLLLSFNATAQRERLQTAFIYQLTRLIEWCPEGKEGNFVIGVLGEEPALLAELKVLQVRRVGTQQIEIKSFDTVADISRANIVFIPESKFDAISQVASQVSGFCSLIVSDRSGAANRGAGVSLVFNQRQAKIEFEISRRYMRQKSFSVNDQLYNLATTVY